MMTGLFHDESREALPDGAKLPSVSSINSPWTWTSAILARRPMETFHENSRSHDDHTCHMLFDFIFDQGSLSYACMSHFVAPIRFEAESFAGHLMAGVV